MRTSLQESQLKRSNILKNIKVEDEVDEGREVIARRATATVKGKDSNLSQCFGLRVTNGFDGRGEIGMKIFQENGTRLIPLRKGK